MDRPDLARLAQAPLLLQTNLVPYVIAGGPLLPRFLGIPESGDAGTGSDPERHPSQMWIASTVTSALGGAEEGLSRIDPGLGGHYLKTLLEAEPDLFLGAGHVSRWGATPGFLVKLLNSRDRLLVQVHPDREKARKHFDSDFGKTEAWYVVDAEPGAVVYAGFRPGITRRLLRQAILGEDSATILGLLHAFPVAPGDVVFIPAGVPHALGPGSLVLEIQEPTDITLRAERRRPSGELLPEEFLHAGRGMDVLLSCFETACSGTGAARKRFFPEPRIIRGGEGRIERTLVSREITSCFSMRSLSLETGVSCPCTNRAFVVGIVVSGSGSIRGAGFDLELRRGSEFFLPHGVPDYGYRAERDLVVVECLPPSEEAGREPVGGGSG